MFDGKQSFNNQTNQQAAMIMVHRMNNDMINDKQQHKTNLARIINLVTTNSAILYDRHLDNNILSHF